MGSEITLGTHLVQVDTQVEADDFLSARLFEGGMEKPTTKEEQTKEQVSGVVWCGVGWGGVGWVC